MENKMEKYFQYIVDDLIKDTEIDRENRTVVFPFLGKPDSPLVTNVYPNWGSHMLKSNSPTYNFMVYVTEKYGVNKTEYDSLWLFYRESLSNYIETLKYGK